MVENFVEKYVPIRIQSTISEVFQYILPYKERIKLSEFEKKKFAELHQIILEDDGIPKLAEQLKQIRMKMDDKSFLKLKKTRGSDSKRSASKLEALTATSHPVIEESQNEDDNPEVSNSDMDATTKLPKHNISEPSPYQ